MVLFLIDVLGYVYLKTVKGVPA